MPRKNNSKNWLAVFLILLGILVLLDQLALFPGSLIGLFWPAVFAFLGIKGLIDQPLKNTVFKSGLVLVAGLLIARNFDLVDFGWEILWPFILIGMGVSFLLDNNFFDKNKTDIEATGNSLDVFTLFSGNEKKLGSRVFEGGSVTNVFGGTEIDLSQCKLEKDVTIDVIAAFGGVSLKVPTDWDVNVEVIPVFGGTEDSRPRVEKHTEAKLTVVGTVIFGAVEIQPAKN